jgi:uncharacterized protein (DUF433 family)
MTERDTIETSPEILYGTLVFAGTHVTVKILFDYLNCLEPQECGE